jgi:transposase
MEIIAMSTTETSPAAAFTTSECAAIFVSLELSRSTWLMTVLAAPLGPKMSRHQVRGGDMPDLLKRFSDLQRTVQHRTGQVVPAITIQEAGLDGFWIHRALVAAGIESHLVDPASIAVSRRHRRAKTDRIDGEALVRTLMAWRRGEPRVCAMVRVPTPEEEDRRRVCRELKSLIGERIRHVNRVKGVLFAQGIGGYEPRNKDRRDRLEELRTGDGRPLPPHLKALVLRELEIIELLNRQIETVKAERDALLAEAQITGSAPAPVRMLLELKGIGPALPAPCGPKGCSGHSRTGARLRPMPDLHPRRGRAARSTTNRGSPRRAIPACAPSAWKWPGSG